VLQGYRGTTSHSQKFYGNHSLFRLLLSTWYGNFAGYRLSIISSYKDRLYPGKQTDRYTLAFLYLWQKQRFGRLHSQITSHSIKPRPLQNVIILLFILVPALLVYNPVRMGYGKKRAGDSASTLKTCCMVYSAGFWPLSTCMHAETYRWGDNLEQVDRQLDARCVQVGSALIRWCRT